MSEDTKYDEKKILRELTAFNSVLRGFCEGFDCGELSCSECPLGYEVCYVIGNDNLRKKYGAGLVARRFMADHYKDIAIVLLLLILALVTR